MILIGSVGKGGGRGDKGLHRMERDLCDPNRECGNRRQGDKGLHRMKRDLCDPNRECRDRRQERGQGALQDVEGSL